MFKIEDIINKVHNSDCLEFLKEVPDGSIDLLYTDPPYKIHFGGGGSLKERYEYRKKDILPMSDFNPNEFLEVVKPKLKHFHAYIWTSKDNLDKYIKFAKDNNYNWNMLIWAKKNPIPAYNNTYLLDTEYCVFIRKKGKCTWNNGLGHDTYRKVMFENIAKNTHGHPTQKHEWMVARAINISSNEGDIVLDPYLGSGTTALVCKQLKRNFIGIEVNEEYYEMARSRTNQTALF